MQQTTSPVIYDLIVRNGTVIDGSKRPRFDADVAVLDGRIAAVGDLGACRARDTIDAKGMIVSPGFIDSHTHDDLALLLQPDMTFKVTQGVTTVITGNCGISIAPLKADTPMPAPLNLLDGEQHLRFERFSDYIQALKNTPAAVNVAAMVGHSTLRVRAMETLGREANAHEIAIMRDMLSEALDAGAIGMSTGTYYPPAAAASTEEIIDVGRPLSSAGGLYATHMRNESDGTMDSLEETFRIGRELDIQVVISHHKLQHPQNFGKSAITLPRIRAAMQCQCVALDCYPYNASSTMLHIDEQRLAGRVMIASSASHPDCAGRDLDDIAAQWQVSKLEAARRLQPASAIYFSMDEGDVRNILAFEDTMIGSDGIPTGEKPHPRLWGTFPRVLGHYCREVGLFPLETAIWKMTGLTARNFGLQDRGQLKPGFHADIVLFDADTVSDQATYHDSTRPAQGIHTVIVNGMPTWREGKHLGARNGKVVARGAREQPAQH
ncbi:D-aminoacylase [Allopusillimonas soli]|uniref:D-aminoacylase n=1 Tax=Allopusillimonas soli TaxID=659016 RepID=A0A853F8C0_9BURK|nr:D-aminoacylase [Allopusillimonas soli]NYT36058.1 D-aminoacylase [Allopusillimonas soli]TEA76397.1 D-aminoacylase [Allopusillimonas soli]